MGENVLESASLGRDVVQSLYCRLNTNNFRGIPYMTISPSLRKQCTRVSCNRASARDLSDNFYKRSYKRRFVRRRAAANVILSKVLQSFSLIVCKFYHQYKVTALEIN